MSHALLLDRPRKGVQALIGRSGADEIDTDDRPARRPRVTPEAGADARPHDDARRSRSTPAKPRKLAFTPKKKLRIWVAGDSLVITPGYAIVRAAGASPAIESVGDVDGRVATGLTRPDVFNWFDEIRRRGEGASAAGRSCSASAATTTRRT